MKVRLYLSHDGGGKVTADVLAVLIHIGMKLYAVTVPVDDAPWFSLVHEYSSALIAVDE